MQLMRRFITIAAIGAIALAAVAKVTLFGHATTTEASYAYADLQSANDWSITGQIQEMNGTFWVIQGFSIQVNDDTRISGVVPTVGNFAAAEGIVQSDGTWLAKRIRVSDRDDFTPTPVESPSATAAPTDTATNTPTPTSTEVGTVPDTATPTATAIPPTSTFTPTSVVTATPTKVRDPDDRNGDENNDKDDRDDDDDRGDKSGPPPHPNPDNNGKHLGVGHGKSQGSQDNHGKGPKEKDD
jgi:hypothetical protein